MLSFVHYKFNQDHHGLKGQKKLMSLLEDLVYLKSL